MVDTPSDVVGPEQHHPGRRLRPPRARIVVALAVVAALVVFVVQNSQRVTVRFWFVTGHVRLIWVIVVCAVGAGAVGFVLGHRGGRRRRRRRRPGPD